MVRATRVHQLRQWLSRHKKKLWIGLAACLLLSIAVQLVYPYGYALPFATVAGQSVGMKKQPEITLAVQTRFSEATVVVRAGEKSKTDKLQYFGATVGANEMAKHATDYPFIFRFVPFSILWYQPHLDRYQLSFDGDRLDSIASEYAKELSFAATDANLAIDKDELTVTQAKSGSKVTSENVVDAVKTSSFNWDKTEVQIDPETVEPSVSDASVADIKQQAEAILAQEINIVIDGDREFKPTRSVIASWLKIGKDKDSGAVGLDYNEPVIASYVSELAKQTGDQPEPIKVKLVDGDEVSRSGGKNGLGIDQKDLISRIEQSLEAPQAAGVSLAIDRQTIKPPLAYDRSYTSSAKGLNAYVKYVTSKGNINIAVSQLEGNRWSAQGNASASIPSASTYKPYLMLKVLDDIGRRDLKWDDKVAGSTIRDCFENMIVVSANPCAEALIERYGIRPLTNYLRDEKGFSSGTGFTFQEVTQTTAADLNKLMIGIENGSLLKGQYRNMMLEKMGRQVYRQGIPAGTSAPVYDKVGFLWDYLHDSAIVRHPKGTYTLVVMTKGESWGKIAEITREIERILYG